MKHTSTNQSDIMGWASSIIRGKMRYFPPIPILWCPCFSQPHPLQWTFFVANGFISSNAGSESSVSSLGVVFKCWEGEGGRGGTNTSVCLSATPYIDERFIVIAGSLHSYPIYAATIIVLFLLEYINRALYWMVCCYEGDYIFSIDCPRFKLGDSIWHVIVWQKK